MAITDDTSKPRRREETADTEAGVEDKSHNNPSTTADSSARDHDDGDQGPVDDEYEDMDEAQFLEKETDGFEECNMHNHLVDSTLRGMSAPPPSHALMIYQMELMLLEQQNRERLLRERQAAIAGPSTTCANVAAEPTNSTPERSQQAVAREA